MARGRRGSIVKKGLKFFLFGDYGTRKSSFCLETLKMHKEDGKPLRVAYIDTEGGSVDNFLESYKEEGYDLNNLYIYYTNSYTEATEFVDKLIEEEEIYELDDNGMITDELVVDAEGSPFIADAIVVDSATVVQDTLKYSKILTSEKRAELRARNKEQSANEVYVAKETAGMEFKDHDKLNQQGKNFLQGLVSRTDKYIFVTSRVKPEKKSVSDGKGGFTSVETGKVLPDCFKKAEYEFYTVLHMYEDEEDGLFKAKVVRKDRTGVFEQNEIIEDPTPMYWQSVIDRNKDRKETVKSNSYNDAVQKDFKESTKGYEDVFKTKTKTEQPKKPQEDLFAELNSLVKKEDRQAISRLFAQNKLPARPSKKTNPEKLQKMIEVIKSYYSEKKE